MNWREYCGYYMNWNVVSTTHMVVAQYMHFSLLRKGKRGAWWAAVHGVARSQTRLTDFTLTSHFHALEEEMATHSSVLAWRIPWTEEPGGLLSMGSHRVRHEWSDLAAAAAASPFAIFGEFWVEKDGVQSTDQFSSVHSLSRVQLFVTPWTAARQAPLSITNSRSSPKPMFIEWHLFSFSYVECNTK